MKKQLFFMPILAIALITVSCGSRKTISSNDYFQITNGQGAISSIQNPDGSVSNTIILPDREDESLFKVEIFAGKEMLIDCNHHGLVGEFEERLSSNDEIVLFFNSAGSVFSTQMACPDDTRHLAFVAAQPHMMRYNSAIPIVVHTPQGISVKHRIWQADDEASPFPPAPRYADTQVLSAFPTEIEGFNRFVLLLPHVEDVRRNNMQVEIIPGKIAYVDCNRHILGGTFSRRTVDGWGFDYVIFSSDGVMASTRMACLEPATLEFVSGPTEIVRYNSQMPIVVFVPIGFEVRYRIWEAPSMQ